MGTFPARGMVPLRPADAPGLPWKTPGMDLSPVAARAPSRGRTPRHAPAAVLALALALAARPAQAVAPPDLAPAPPPAHAPDPARGEGPPRLTLDVPAALATTGGLFLLAGLGALGEDRLVPPACRWCEPDQLDRWARAELRWEHPAAAATASDLLVVAVPAGSVLALGLAARHAGAGWREVGEDVLVVAEAVAVATVLTQASKVVVARLRPYGWAEGGSTAVEARLSFWSGHTALTFSAAAAATQVARLRGRAGWRWLAAIAFTGAAVTGWLRMAGDRHWATDVVTGALVGTAAGLGVPRLVLRPGTARAPPVELSAAPGGLALRF